MSSLSLDGTLLDWSSIAGEMRGGLLMGNGASMAVWSKFHYDSLFDEARTAGSLGRKAVRLFADLKTRNFEQVLSRLMVTRLVKESLREDVTTVRELYQEVRDALIKAVQQVHIPYGSVPESIRDAIHQALLAYDIIYTTNYDLLAYWAIQRDQSKFDDLFRKRNGELVFLPLRENRLRKRVLYMHGGIHLFRARAGVTFKDEHDGTEDLLTRFQTRRDWLKTVPLFVSEGTAADKLRTIRGSEYLSYCLNRFARHSGQLVIFGLGMWDSDDHIAQRVRAWGRRRIAVSVRPSDPEIVDTKARYYHALGYQHDLVFFDSSTHPLGDSRLKVG